MSAEYALDDADRKASQVWTTAEPGSGAEKLAEAVRSLVPPLRDLLQHVAALRDAMSDLQEQIDAARQRLDAGDALEAERRERNG